MYSASACGLRHLRSRASALATSVPTTTSSARLLCPASPTWGFPMDSGPHESRCGSGTPDALSPGRSAAICRPVSLTPTVAAELVVVSAQGHLEAKKTRNNSMHKSRWCFFRMSGISQILGTSAHTAENDWKFARAWLGREWNGNAPTN
jgi:hypothetical protein